MNLATTIYCEYGGGDATRATLPSGSVTGPNQTSYNRAAQRKGGADKGGIVGAKIKKKRKAKANVTATSAAPSEGSSKVSRSYRVTDGMGRVLHKFRTKEEAEQASAGNRYSRVVSQIPPDETPEVRDNIRRRPADTQVKVFRRSQPYPNPLPSGPMGR